MKALTRTFLVLAEVTVFYALALGLEIVMGRTLVIWTFGTITVIAIVLAVVFLRQNLRGIGQ